MEFLQKYLFALLKRRVGAVQLAGGEAKSTFERKIIFKLDKTT
jgi:hypothetical protein